MSTAKAVSKAIFILLLTGSSASVLTAQQAPFTRCSERNAIGWLGISGLSCTNCVFSLPGRGAPTLFSTEPRITAVASGSPAGEVLRPGDVLVSIDGNFITTHAGGSRFNNLKPGDDVTLVVRRNGEQLTYTLEDLPSICANDARVPGHNAPPEGFVSGAQGGGGARVGGARVGGARAGAVRPPPVAAQAPPPPTVRPTPSPQRATTVVTAGRRMTQIPRVSFGFSFDCRPSCVSAVDVENRELVWEFASHPQVYQVEQNSEAARQGIRRGDVITHINGVDLESPEGGREFGRVQPGQSVEFTIRRGSQTLRRTLRAQRHATADVTTAARESETSLQQARHIIDQLRRQQELEAAQLDRLRRSESPEVRALTEQLRKQQAEQEIRMQALRAEIARADAQLRAATPPRETYALTPSARGELPTRSTAPVRYVGRIGDTDIEVRGGTAVQVEEDVNGDIIIRVGVSEIRLKRARERR